MNKEERTMGRQYNYYISPEEELDFTKKLMDKGYLILETQKTSIDDKDIWKWKILSLEDIWLEINVLCHGGHTFIKKNGEN